MPKRITMKDRLDVIREELVEMKKMDIPVTLIRKILHERGIDVGYQSLRLYFKSVIGKETTIPTP